MLVDHLPLQRLSACSTRRWSGFWHVTHASLFVVMLAISTGCQPPDSNTTPTLAEEGISSSTTASDDTVTEQASTEEAPTTSSNASEATSAESAISVQLVDIAGFEEQLKKLAGKVVVADVWSTSCPPCMREYPHLVTLSKRWPEQVACVSLNVDYIGIKSKPADSYLPKVSEFLVKQESQTVINLLSTEADSDVFEKLKIDSIPAAFVYDREGKLVKTFSEANSGDDGLTYDGDIIPMIEAMLAK